MKIIAFYLPQFHEIPENNNMWGEGFTEWVNVKKAKPLFDGHFQPVEPLNDNYYDLTDIDVMRWQIELAKKYGLYGFCFYHYWYNGHKLLHIPVENYLKDKSQDFPYCLCWANHDWTMAWVNKKDNVIFGQDYSKEEDWKEHFNYFLSYFKDERYIKINGKPLLVIYQNPRQDNQKFFVKMLDYWINLAKKNGFDGICYTFQSVDIDLSAENDIYGFDYDIEYQPHYVHRLVYKRGESKFINFLKRINAKTFRIKYASVSKYIHRSKVEILDYDECWQKILEMGPIRPNSIPCAFVGCDTTPRRGERGMVIQGMTPEKFQKYLKAQIKRAKDVYKKDMMFIFAWNEWAEGAYMEPDKRWGYGVLDAMYTALRDLNELPENIKHI
jgi:hypothetical protein